MDFFTARLFTNFNSLDDDVADQADAAWETASAMYKEYLDKKWKHFPQPVRDLAMMCFHDAPVLLRGQEVTPSHYPDLEIPYLFPFWSACQVIALKVGNDIVTLQYWLTEEVRFTPAPDDWPDKESPESWLYDEVGLVAEEKRRHIFFHKILLSSGLELEVRFFTFKVIKVPLPAETAQDVK